MLKGIVVDDAAVMRMRLKDILAERYEIVAECENGVQALEAFVTHKPDFVTMDITMAEMNGMEALENILKQFPDAKIVMVSALGQKQLVFEALSKGAKDFIVKPFERDRVLLAVGRLFE